VSHIPQRKEKDCLNCGAIVHGRYCHICGQENVVPKESFWHMVTHFFYDVTHFDSNFFHTVHHLLFKPGFLSKEYTAGRRASYLHPIRMYVFTSAVFFLLFFGFFKNSDNTKTNIDDPLTKSQRERYIRDITRSLNKDSAIKYLEGLRLLNDTSQTVTLDTLFDLGAIDPSITFSGNDYKTKHEYDSVQKTLASKDRDSWLKRRLVYKEIDSNEKIRENPDEALEKFSESLLHRLPYMLFVSLPLFALILKLVYIRRKQFFFSDHGVFTIHLYIFSFLLLIAVFAVGKIEDLAHIDIDFLVVILFLLLFFYLYKAMRNFYGQRRIKTFIKFLLVALLSLIMMLILFLFFLFFSAVTF
jgi:hypothetical protein